MHHAFLYISLPSTARLPVKVLNFTFCEGRKQAMTKFFLVIVWLIEILAPEELACIWQSKRVGIITIETEKKIWIYFSMWRFRGCQPSWYLLKTLYKYIYAKTWPMQEWITVISWSLYFWKSVFSFRADSSLKSDGGLYQTESFLTACISLVHEPDKPWSRQ